MVDLRKAARGRMCTVRILGYCNHDPETSVLAHYRLAGTCGTATKPHDMQAAIACMRGWTIKGKPASGRAVLSQEQDGIKS
ncbi:nuclease domain-containing protein, partial [Escherichia coli]